MSKEAKPKLKYMLEIGVKAIIENSQGLILVVKDAASGNWTLPGGRIELGETPQVALTREIEDEVGLKLITIGKPTSAWFFFIDDEPNQQVVLLNCRCQAYGTVKLGRECSASAWISPQEFLTLPLPHESLRYTIGQEYGLFFQPPGLTKLVRDKIPEIMKGQGKEVRVKKLTSQEHLQALLEKLKEEAREATSAKTREELISELADVLEVIDAILKEARISKKEVEKNKQTRRKERGGFKKKLFLF